MIMLTFKKLKKEELVSWIMGHCPNKFSRSELVSKSPKDLLKMIRELSSHIDAHSVRAYHVNYTRK